MCFVAREIQYNIYSKAIGRALLSPTAAQNSGDTFDTHTWPDLIVHNEFAGYAEEQSGLAAGN